MVSGSGADPKARNLTWHGGEVSREARERARGHRGATVWLTGLSGSGKSSIARRAEALLFQRGVSVYVLDGDNIRHGLNKDLGFSPGDRSENIRRIGEVAKLFTDAGVLTLSAFISPYRSDRDAVRASMGVGDFLEVFVDAPLDVCEARDPKGLYAKARAGKVAEMTGLSAPYEAPLTPELVLSSGTQSVDESARRLLAMLEERGVIQRARVKDV